ncbi:hypothetical protein [Nocardioides daejeonensis]|uniref:hypothetical protein n=1 Tax=Nocardioides daejeonensis TaxID=1046556 RepID=UPI000D74F594|nr:hypothetical protein [Nocardioides daejeonensis]
MSLTLPAPRPVKPALLPLVLVCVCVLATMITWAFRSMRAVMAVGGSCADGGPYVSAQPCPDGAWMIGVAIPVSLLACIIGTGIAMAAGARELFSLLWGGLFGALGWNFIDSGIRGSGGDKIGGYLLGGMFWLMALPAVLFFLGLPSIKAAVRARRPQPAPTDLETLKLAAAGVRPPSAASAVLRDYSFLLVYLVVGAAGVWLGWWSWGEIVG